MKEKNPPHPHKQISREPDGAMDATLKASKAIYVGCIFQECDLRSERKQTNRKKKNVFFILCDFFVWLRITVVSDFHMHQPSSPPNGRCIMKVRSDKDGCL